MRAGPQQRKARVGQRRGEPAARRRRHDAIAGAVQYQRRLPHPRQLAPQVGCSQDGEPRREHVVGCVSARSRCPQHAGELPRARVASSPAPRQSARACLRGRQRASARIPAAPRVPSRTASRACWIKHGVVAIRASAPHLARGAPRPGQRDFAAERPADHVAAPRRGARHGVSHRLQRIRRAGRAPRRSRADRERARANAAPACREVVPDAGGKSPAMQQHNVEHLASLQRVETRRRGARRRPPRARRKARCAGARFPAAPWAAGSPAPAGRRGRAPPTPRRPPRCLRSRAAGSRSTTARAASARVASAPAAARSGSAGDPRRHSSARDEIEAFHAARARQHAAASRWCRYRRARAARSASTISAAPATKAPNTPAALPSVAM